MSFVSHHFFTLIRRFRVPVACYFAAWAVLTAAVWHFPHGGYWERISGGIHWALLGAGALLAAAAVLQDPASGTDVFWRTRPLHWQSLVAAQLLFLLVCAGLAPLGCWVVNGLMLASTASQWIHGCLDAVLLLCPFLAAAGAASCARSGYQVLLVIASSALIWLAALYLSGQVIARADLSGPSRIQLDRAITAGLVLVPALLALIMWLVALRRKGCSPRLWWMGAILLLLLPAAAALALVRLAVSHEPPLALELRAFDTAEVSGGVAIGDLSVRGVPPGQTPVPDWNNLSMVEAKTGREAGYNGTQVGHFRPDDPVAFVTESVVTPLLPRERRWYFSDTRSGRHDREAYGFNLGRAYDDSVLFRLKGKLGGTLVSAAKLASVALAPGASAAENGCRVTISELKVNPAKLIITADIRSASALQQTLMPSGRAFIWNDFTWDGLIIHVPDPGFCIVVDLAESREGFSSWQTVARRVEVDCELPLAEAIRGVRFTDSMLERSELVMFRLRADGDFIAAPSDGPYRMPSGEVPQETIPVKPAPTSAEALELLHSTSIAQPVSLLTLAAIASKLGDYPALNRKLSMLPRIEPRQTSSPELRRLFISLKALPGFDWKPHALDHWKRIVDSDFDQYAGYEELQLWAALAGDAVAFNKIAERESLAETDAKTGKLWAELADMVEGIPADGPERKAWLLRRWGYFTFDEAAGRYRVRPDLPAE